MNDPSPTTAWIQRGLILQEQGRYREAEGHFREALAVDPSNVLSLINLAICQRQQQQYTEALGTIERAIQLEPNYAELHAIQSLIFSDLKKLAQALAAAEETLKLDPQCLQGYIALGVAQLGREKWPEVEKAARQALVLDPNDSRAANLLATSLRLQNKMAENAAQIQGMLQRDPENAHTHASAGWAALQRGQYQEADGHFREALRLNPELETARLGLLESFKARSPIYRAYLNYCFFMQRLSRAGRWAVILGLYIAVRLSGYFLVGTAPGLYLAIFSAYLIFALWTHVAPAVGNLIILGDPLARHALRPSERWSGILSGGGLVLGLILIPSGVIFHSSSTLLLGMVLAGAAFPLRYALGNASRLGQWLFGLAGAGLVVTGLLYVGLGWINPRSQASLESGLMLASLFVVAGTTWLANLPFLRRYLDHVSLGVSFLSGFNYYLRRLWWSLIPNAAPVTNVVIGLNIIAYLAQLVCGHFRPHWLEEILGLSPSWLVDQHYWQVVSYAWLHDEGNPLHLLLNMMVVRFFGEQIEWALGARRFILLYVGGTVAAGLAWLYFGQVAPDSMVIGASGAAFTLVVSNALFDPQRVLKVWLFFIIPLRLTTQSLALLLVASEFIMLHFKILPDIAHTAHLGGAAFGWAMMKIWRIRSTDHYPAGGPVSRL